VARQFKPNVPPMERHGARYGMGVAAAGSGPTVGSRERFHLWPFLNGEWLRGLWRPAWEPRHHVSNPIQPEAPMKTATPATALLVIDVQESFRGRPYWQAQEVPPFLANTRALIDRCREQGIPVLQVFHQEPGADSRNPFHPQSGLIRAMPELELQADAVFYKEVHSACTARRPKGSRWRIGFGATPLRKSWSRASARNNVARRPRGIASDAGFKCSLWVTQH